MDNSMSDYWKDNDIEIIGRLKIQPSYFPCFMV